MDRNYTFSIAVGTLLIAEELTRLESDVERKRKKQRVLERKRKLIRETFPDVVAGVTLEGDAGQLLSGNWDQDDAFAFLVDLSFTNPFAPYELSFKDSDFEVALVKVADLVDLDSDAVVRIREKRSRAVKAHRGIEWGKVARWSLGGLVVLSTGGALAAPAIVTWIGTSAGLFGAAATSHGLALLGGGSLALGGYGMAGGMSLLIGAGASLGVLTSFGGTVLLQLGEDNARVELLKLQIVFSELVQGDAEQINKGREIVRSLIKQRDEIRKQVEEERELNESNSARLKDMEATLKAVEDTLEWMRNEAS